MEVAIVVIQRFRSGTRTSTSHIAWAMLPALISAMAACTWHLYDNSKAFAGW